MAKLDGQTPEQIAKDALKDVDIMFTVPTVTNEALDTLAKYQARDIINIKGDKYWENNKDRLRTDMLTKLVTDKVEALTKYMTKKEETQALDFYKSLVARGVSREEAMQLSGLNRVG